MTNAHRTSALVILSRGALASALLAALSSGLDAQRSTEGLDVTERIYGLSLIWTEAAYNFPYFDQVPELDWDSAYRSFIPRVVEARSTFDYYRELQRFTALLRDGHSRVAFPDTIVARQPFSSPWVELETVGGEPMVANVALALADSLPIGSRIVRVEGLSVDAYLEEHSLPYVFASAERSRRISAIEGSHTRGYGLFVGPSGSPVRVVARTPSGSEVELTLARDRFSTPREWARSPDAGRGPLLEIEWVEPDVVYLALNTFSDPSLIERIDSLLPDLRRARGVILDLRKNGGGSDLVAEGVLARFTDHALVGTGSRIRIHNAYYRALGSFGRAALESALPPDSVALVERALRHHRGDAWREEAPDSVLPDFAGERVRAPVAVLIGRGTGSAAENFVVRIPDEPRFITVGSPTAASTGQPLVFQLPGGGVGQVVTRAALLPDGTPVVAAGIRPDLPVDWTIDDVLQGRDPDLERALTTFATSRN